MIEKIFYEEIIPECSNKTLSVGDFKPTIFFDVKFLEENNNMFLNENINPKPVLVINNKEKFNKALNDYVLSGIKFYYDGVISHDNIKSLIAYVFSNATQEDLVNPVLFLNLRKSFFDFIPDDYNIKKSLLGYDGEIIISKLKPILEAPFSFEFKIKSLGQMFALPNIIFGRANVCPTKYNIWY